MIKKLEITNVGRFKSAKTDGDEQFFKKNTFIYGKNTYGKSTLTSIFRSLRENNTDYIVGRKTTGAQKQTVKIIPDVTTPIGEYRYTTDEGKWSAQLEEILIFDNHFVRESVYAQTQHIGQEQQRNIELFMLGAKGAEYNKKINILAEQIATNTRTQTSINTEYSRNKHLLGGLSFEVFLNLAEVLDADLKIESEQKDLDKIKNSELISSKLGQIKSALEKYKDFDTTKIVQKLSVNNEVIEKHFSAHVNQKETKQNYSTFLQTGAKLRTRTKDELCPFCTQPIVNKSAQEFINTIDAIYNENYRSIQQAVKDAENLFDSNSLFSKFVEPIITDLQQAGYVLDIDFANVDDEIKKCSDVVAKKKENLADDVDAQPFADLTSIAESHVGTLDAELKKFANPSESKARLEGSIKNLQASKERSGSWKSRCEDYLKAKEENEKLGADKTTLWDKYLAYANELSTTMLTDINTVLRACNCSFIVQTFNFKGNQRQDLFVLSIDGNQIANKGDDHEMTIKNYLSDSDKWILALSFFLTTVKNDSSVKVVVMDDPVSSFDVDRKRIILTEIKRILSGTDKQLVLLTHERGFYHLLNAENISDTSSVFLKIVYDSTSGSDLVECKPDEDPEFMTDYNCWIADMKNANSLHDLTSVKKAHTNIRLVIEHVLKAKYPLELTKEHNTVSVMLTKLEQPGGPYVTNSPRTRIESLLANLSHHDHSGTGQYPSSHLGIEDFKKDIRDAFDVLKTL